MLRIAVVILLWGCFCVPMVAVGQKPAAQEEKVLRARAEEFYSLLQSGRWIQAEQYVTKDTLDNFKQESKKPFLGFEVESVKFDAGGTTATVNVKMQAFIQFSTGPVTLPRISQWRLEDGAWFVVVARAAEANSKDLFDRKLGNKPAPPAPEELKFKGHRYGLGIVLQGQMKSARFPFTNVTNHVVTLSEVVTACDCLRVKTEKKVYKPGEEGELVIEFDPTGYADIYDQTIIVRTEPGSVKTLLQISALVGHPPAETPKQPEKKSVPLNNN